MSTGAHVLCGSVGSTRPWPHRTAPSGCLDGADVQELPALWHLGVQGIHVLGFDLGDLIAAMECSCGLQNGSALDHVDGC